MIRGATAYAFFSFSPRLLENYMSEGYVSLMLLFQPVIVILFSNFFGRISDKKRNRKRFVVYGMLALVISYIILHLYVITGINDLVISLVVFIIVFSIRGLAVALSACESSWFTDFTYTKKMHQDGSSRNKHTGVSYYFLLSSVSWAVGIIALGYLVQIFTDYNLGLICFMIGMAGFIPLYFIKDNFAKHEKKETNFHFKQDLKDLDQGMLVFPAIGIRHFGLITALSLVSLVLKDLGINAAVSGVIMSLNPSFQIPGMICAILLLSRLKVKPLFLFATGLLLSTLAVLFYAVTEATNGESFIILGQILIGFGWPTLIIGFEEYIIKNVDWYKRANYASYRQTFMNSGKVLGQLFYFMSFELLGFARLNIFFILVFFPLTGLSLAIISIIRRSKKKHETIVHKKD